MDFVASFAQGCEELLWGGHLHVGAARLGVDRFEHRVRAGLAELVDLHFFGGFTFGEIAALRHVSERTVQRDWKKAKLFLHQVLRES